MDASGNARDLACHRSRFFHGTDGMEKEEKRLELLGEQRLGVE
jgi:hypothetical protein